MAKDPLSAGQRSHIRRLSQPKEPDEEGAGELNVVPFLDIITNVMMFVLATVAVTFTATLDVNPPRRIPGSHPAPMALGLTVLVVPDGFSIKAKGGNVAPGCESLGSGLAVAKVAGEYDYASLGKCVRMLKASSEDFADESNITITADPEIPYQAVIGVMDAVRKTDDGKDLFADVNFGMVR